MILFIKHHFKHCKGYLVNFCLRFVGISSLSPFWLVSTRLHGGAKGKCLVGFIGCLLWQFLLIKKQMLMYCNRMFFFVRGRFVGGSRFKSRDKKITYWNIYFISLVIFLYGHELWVKPVPVNFEPKTSQRWFFLGKFSFPAWTRPQGLFSYMFIFVTIPICLSFFLQ